MDEKDFLPSPPQSDLNEFVKETKVVKKRKKRKKLWVYRPRNIIIRKNIYAYEDPSVLTPRQQILWLKKHKEEKEKNVNIDNIFKNEFKKTKKRRKKKEVKVEIKNKKNEELKLEVINKNDSMKVEESIYDIKTEQEIENDMLRNVNDNAGKFKENNSNESIVEDNLKLFLESSFNENVNTVKTDEISRPNIKVIDSHANQHFIISALNDSEINNINQIYRKETIRLLKIAYNKHHCRFKRIILLEILKSSNENTLNIKSKSFSNELIQKINNSKCCTN